MSTPCQAIRVPGPQGGAGDDGTNGANGLDAFSYVAAQFDVPAQQDTVEVTLVDPAGNRWMLPGGVVAVQGAGTGGTVVGYYGVVSLSGTDTVTLINLRDDTTGLYPDNLDGTGTIAAGMAIVPGGLQGPGGSTPAGAFLVANDLSEGDPATMRTNLGLGTMAVQNANAVAVTGGTIAGITDLAVLDGGTGASTAVGARTNLGAAASGLATASGLTASATDVVLGRFSAGAGAVEELTFTAYARSLATAATAAAARVLLELLKGYGVLGSVTAWNLNAGVTDTPLTMLSSRYIVDKIVVENASANLTVATGGVFTAAGGGGTTLAADQALSALTASSKFLELTLAGIVGTDVVTAATLYARCGTPQGGAATANLWVMGWKLD